MKILDDNFLQNKWKYVVQCLIATAFLYFILFYVDIVLKTTVVASIGATSFIVFSMPNKISSTPRCVLGGYIVGAIAGGLCNLIGYFYPFIPFPVLGAIAITISMFLMVILNMEHPPASAFAVGMVIEKYNIYTVLMVLGIAITLLFIKKLIGRWLIDL